MNATVYTIPAGFAFSDALAHGLLTQYQDSNTPLSKLELYLPNRRSCRTVSDSFLKLTDGAVTILPRLNPIGDIDIDEVLLSDIAPDLTIHDPIDPMTRQFLLAQLIMQRPDMDLSYDQAIRLALDLGQLIDQTHAYGLSLEELHDLVPDEFADHWRITIDFLSIVIQNLPLILEEKGLSNPSEYRNQLLRLKSENLTQSPPAHPIIAAGATGAIPATAELLVTIANLPNGCVVLPGLDQHLDDDAWSQLDESHPQYNIKKLLDMMGITRADVKPWPHLTPDKTVDPKAQRIISERAALVSELSRPANTTQKWATLRLDETCIDGITQINAQNPQEETQIIALMMREVLEKPQKTALLVTPDRALARRVAADLRRWNVDCDDSAGVPLSQTSLGHFLTLAGMMMNADYHTVTLLELLKHPFCHLGYERATYISLLNALEKHIIRGPKLSGFTALKEKINGLENEEIRDPLMTLAEKIEILLIPLWALDASSFPDWVEGHLTLCHRLADQTDLTGEEALWRGDDGEAAADLFTQLRHGIEWHPEMISDDYTQVITTLMEQIPIRPRFQRHPRLKILSPMEARLQSADLIILGGMNEGTWPANAGNDPWMSRPMRKQFGLPGLEQKIGIAAHDFCHALCGRHVVITRSKMSDGAETVPCRWLLRMETVLKQSKIDHILSGATPYQDLAQIIDQTSNVQQCMQPAPTPPVHLRPRKLSATAIETWIRDPYSIYARYILNLRKLDPIEDDQDRRDWGNFVHHVLDLFTSENPKMEDARPLDRLITLAEECLKETTLRSEQTKQWRLKFRNIAAWYIDFERQNSAIKNRFSERDGQAKISNDGADFTLTGKADRMDITQDNGLQIIDYKTGAVPSGKDVVKGYSPQLPLMGLIAQKNGFAEVVGHKIDALKYYKVSGKPADPVTVSNALSSRDKTPLATLIHDTEKRLVDMIAAFDKLDTPYWSIPNFKVKPRYNDYKHLARVQEWSLADDNDGGDAS